MSFWKKYLILLNLKICLISIPPTCNKSRSSELSGFEKDNEFSSCIFLRLRRTFLSVKFAKVCSVCFLLKTFGQKMIPSQMWSLPRTISTYRIKFRAFPNISSFCDNFRVLLLNWEWMVFKKCCYLFRFVSIPPSISVATFESRLFCSASLVNQDEWRF